MHTHNQLPDFTQASILVVGDIMLDRYWFGDAVRISPEAPVPVVNVRQQDERPGGAGNVALNIAALGAKIMLLGIVGKDDAAESLFTLLNAAHVDHAIQQRDDSQTITKLRIISRHQQLLRLDFEEKCLTFPPDLLIEQFKKYLSMAHLVILSDYQKGTLRFAPDLIRLAKTAGIPVLVDPKGNDFSIYKDATIITPNLKEFETIMGRSLTEAELVKKGKQLLQQHGIHALLLTRGEQGMTLICNNQEEIHLPAHAREVYDVTGAGDTVISVLGAALAAGASLPQAMVIANLAASLVVAKLGAASVSYSELEVAFSHTEEPAKGIVSEDQLFKIITHARQYGKKIVFTNGCFDILHAGHVRYLQQAKQLGDYLIIAINDDQSVTRLKGSDRPINSVEHRLTVLAGLSCVDWVISFADDTPERLLKKYQPDILVKGGDYTTEQVVGAEIVYAYGGNVRVLSVTKNVSTSAIINRARSTIPSINQLADSDAR